MKIQYIKICGTQLKQCLDSFKVLMFEKKKVFKLKIHDLSFYFMWVEEEQINPKISRKKEIIMT